MLSHNSKHTLRLLEVITIVSILEISVINNFANENIYLDGLS